jgi:NDP-sugar pyrophosphorylase family protein
MKKKYKLVEDDFIIHEGRKLYRIKALKKIDTCRGAGTIIKEGDKGGYVEGYHNLSQEGGCWIFDSSRVYGNAKVLDDAILMSASIIYGNAMIKDSALIYQSKVYDNAIVRGNSYVSYSRVYDNACIEKKENMSRTKVIESEIHDNANIMDEVISHSEICDNTKVSGASRKTMSNESMIYVPIVYKDKISNNSII